MYFSHYLATLCVRILEKYTRSFDNSSESVRFGFTHFWKSVIVLFHFFIYVFRTEIMGNNWSMLVKLSKTLVIENSYRSTWRNKYSGGTHPKSLLDACLPFPYWKKLEQLKMRLVSILSVFGALTRIFSLMFYSHWLESFKCIECWCKYVNKHESRVCEKK